MCSVAANSRGGRWARFISHDDPRPGSPETGMVAPYERGGPRAGSPDLRSSSSPVGPGGRTLLRGGIRSGSAKRTQYRFHRIHRMRIPLSGRRARGVAAGRRDRVRGGGSGARRGFARCRNGNRGRNRELRGLAPGRGGQPRSRRSCRGGAGALSRYSPVRGGRYRCACPEAPDPAAAPASGRAGLS